MSTNSALFEKKQIGYEYFTVLKKETPREGCLIARNSLPLSAAYLKKFQKRPAMRAGRKKSP